MANTKGKAKLNVGLIGLGRLGHIYARDLATRIPCTRLVAVAARDSARAESFARQHGVERVVDSYEALVEDPEVEAIYNPLANGLHGPWNLRAGGASNRTLDRRPLEPTR